MQPDLQKYLRDMLDAAQAIEEYTRGKVEADYLASRALRDAVHWNFCVIGEALSQLLAKDDSFTDLISETRRIIGLRNQLIHGYGVINNQITWNVIQTK